MIKDLLKFSTAGSVDDGKSTLIGRLLHDTRSIYEDQLEAIARASKKTNAGSLDLALLTDGLRAEREQGITIDVAYRYFSSPSRKYILSDSPGHVQFTRNMVTAVCGSDLVILILDARHGLKEQTRRHTFIAEFLGIKHLIVCINKMDLVDFSEEAYEGVCADFRSFSSKTKIPEIHFIPVSALLGDNIFEKSERMHWYDGPTLFYLLENIQVHSDHDWVNCRFPVQTVIRSRHAQDGGRAYAGRLAAGKLKKEDEVVILPSGIDSRIRAIYAGDAEVQQAVPLQSVSLILEDEVDVGRGDMIVKKCNLPVLSQELNVQLCWLSERPLAPGARYILRHCAKEMKCIIKEIIYKVDINTLHHIENISSLGLNDIGRVCIKTSEPLIYDIFSVNKITGSLILVDEFSNATVAAGVIGE